jgi:hypothetical protein
MATSLALVKCCGRLAQDNMTYQAPAKGLRKKDGIRDDLPTGIGLSK